MRIDFGASFVILLKNKINKDALKHEIVWLRLHSTGLMLTIDEQKMSYSKGPKKFLAF